MAATSDETKQSSHGLLLWVEWPTGCWNAIFQASKSPFKGDLKVDPFRGKATEADNGQAIRTAARVLSQETHQLFDFDPQALSDLLGPEKQTQDVFHFRLALPEGQSIEQLVTLLAHNSTVLGQQSADKGLAILFVPTSSPKSFQPTQIRATPQVTKLIDAVAKIAPATLPTIAAKLQVDEGEAALKRFVLSDEKAPAAGEVTDRHRVADEELAWRYSPAIYEQLASSSTAAKATKAQLSKALKQKRDQAASTASSKPVGRGGGAAGAQRGKAKPTSKPKATSC